MYKISILALCIIITGRLSSQNSATYFDERAAIEQAKAKGIKTSEIQGYVSYLRYEFSAKHTQHQSAVAEDIIYLSPQAPTSADCPNMGFEQLSFSGWIGSTGVVSPGPSGGYPVYTTSVNAIVSPAGNNVSLVEFSNYHTLMNVQPSNPVYPNCIGFDSIACRAVGTTTISQIPFINPYSTDGVSVRMGSLMPNYRASRLKYITTTSATNTKLNYSFALVLDNMGHASFEAPYFKVEVRNETTGMLVPGCNNSIIYSGSATSADSVSVIRPTSIYKTWQQFFVDLSMLPPGTPVSVNFEVGGCAQGGHFGYAYVDAECGSAIPSTGTNFINCNYCAGDAQAALIAPQGFLTYQWYDASNNPIANSNNDTLIVNSPGIGDVYSVQLTTPANCVQTKTVSISASAIAINTISSAPSCPGGNSGSATVYVSGGGSIYSYTWTNMSNGNIAGNSQTAVNLAPVNYSVTVASGMCGQVSSTVSVPSVPNPFTTQYKYFCGNSAIIAQPGGSNYKWYAGSSLVPAPNGTNDSLFISNAVHNANYTLVYINASGCLDSTKYILQLSTSGSINTSGGNVCIGNTNGSGSVTLFPVNAAPYSFSVQDVNGTIASTVQSTTGFSVTGLSAGSYTAIVTDGNCIYRSSFSVNVTQINFTMTPGTTTSCLDTAAINFSFDNIPPVACGLSSAGLCSSPSVIAVGNGTVTNRFNRYPSIYGHYFKNARHQVLYTAAELLSAGLTPGKISAISFKIDTIPVGYIGSLPGFTIKLKCTSATAVTHIFDNSSFSQSYSATSYTPVVGWNTHTFTNAYEWDGVSNLLVDVCFAINPGGFSNNPIMPSDSTTSYRCVYTQNDVTSLCASTNTGQVTYRRPNIRFENCGITNSASYSISVSSNGNMTHNYNNDSIVVVAVGTPTAAQEYTITVTDIQSGCSGTQTYLVPIVPKGVVTHTNASCGACADGAVNVIPSCGTPPYSFIWSPGGATSQSVSGLVPGCYTVTITDANNEITSESTCVTFATGLNNSTESNQLQVYPNPGNGVYTVLSSAKIKEGTIEVVNTLGQTVFTESIKNTSQLQIDISKMSKGIYYLKLQSGQGSSLVKLVLE